MEASSSTLGVCYNYFSRCGSSEWECVDKDLIFRRDGDPNSTGGSVTWEWGTGTPGAGESDFESVALHELGHAHGLGHVNSPGAVMNFSITTGTSNRTLGTTDDIAGGTEVSDNSVDYSPPAVGCGGEWGMAREYLANGGGACISLPVELLTFNARQQNSEVLLEWLTASELNSKAFVLERSVDGKIFEKLGVIRSEGDENLESGYYFIDNAPLIGINYYRLKQLDWNEQEEDLGIVSVEFRGQTNIQLFPNPIKDAILQLVIDTEQNTEALLEIVDLAGRHIYQNSESLVKGRNHLAISLPELLPGVYISKVVLGNEIRNIRFVKE